MPPGIRDIALNHYQLWITSSALVLQLVTLARQLYANDAYWSQPYHTSILTGQMWVDELIRGHPERIYHELGVHLHVFVALVVELRGLGYHDTKYISLEEQLAIFLYSARTGLGCRHVGERFQRANATVTKFVRKMTFIFSSESFYNKYVTLPTSLDPPANYLRQNPKFWPFFENCLGALDGSHIACTSREEDRGNTRNRKGFLSQNVLAVCSFGFQFIYILSGWEGSVTDAFLYADARMKDFRIPEGFYYLGDAGFAITAKVLIPYKGVRYHLREWARGKQRPKDREELFNLRHAQARNIIERIFGVIKKRWRILVFPPSYSMDIQARIPPALAALHNFILKHDPDDRVDAKVRDPSPGSTVHPDDIEAHGLQGELATERRNEEESDLGAEIRDEIADAMWASYQEVLAERAAQGLDLPDEDYEDEEEENEEEQEGDDGDEDNDIFAN